MKKNLLIIILIIAAILISSCSSAGVREDVSVSDTGQYKGDLEKFFGKYENVPHKMGATGPKAFDCSGFVGRAYREVYGIELPRTSQTMYGIGKSVKKSDLKYGDLVFFNIYGKGISHVGIYTGKNTFIHASTKLGVTKSDLNLEYYRTRYVGARRILE